MKINKKQYTYHAYKRVKERFNLNDNELYNLSFYAIKNGIGLIEIPDGPLRKYVEKRALRGRRIKLYRECVFIFFWTSRRMITCYPLPRKFLDEYKIIWEAKQKKKRKKKEC